MNTTGTKTTADAPAPASVPHPGGDSVQPVLVIGAGPVGCTAALLLADRGIPVTVLERQLEPHPLPRAVHVDDEVARILGRVGVADAFLRNSRAASGLRLVDAQHRVIAEFPRALVNPYSGVPSANMFDQPELEQLLLGRIDEHPLVTLHRGVEVLGLHGVDDRPSHGALSPIRVDARDTKKSERLVYTARFVLGGDGGNSQVRRWLGIEMEDLHFTERWLVIDVRSDSLLDSWGGVEQVCDPARAATFMRVVGDRYRWEFQLQDGEDESDLLEPPALARLLAPWTGRSDLEGLEIVRSATYTFRARLASRFRVGQVFLLGDAAHLTPPFIGQGLGAGLRDADNLAWKVAAVLSESAESRLLETYESERRPHARALVRKAVLIGWTMTGGQDRAAVVRRLALAAAVRSSRICDLIAATETPPLRNGALEPLGPVRRLLPQAGRPRVGGLVPNVDVRTPENARMHLDDLLKGRPAVLTSGRPGPATVELCRKRGIELFRLHAPDHRSSPPAGGAGYTDVVVVGQAGPLTHVLDDAKAAVLMRPDGIVAAVSRDGLPRIPWAAGSEMSHLARSGGTQ